MKTDQTPVVVQQDRTLRVKIIDSCGLTCTFCHNEGTPVASDGRRSNSASSSTNRSGRVSIYAQSNGVNFLPATIAPDQRFSHAIQALSSALNINELHLTGGEPTLHPNLAELIHIGRTLGLTVSMTSNGENGPRSIPACAKAGLDRVNFSIFGTTARELLQVQNSRFQNAHLAERKIASLRESITIAAGNRIRIGANIVVPSLSHRDRVMRLMNEFSPQLSIRLLNSLDDGKESLDAIGKILTELGARPVATYVTAGVSGSRTKYRLKNGREIFVKHIRRTRLPLTCGTCRFNNDRDCQEGFYGVRLYRDQRGRFMVGVCIQRMDLCQPLDEFLESDLCREIVSLRRDEAAKLAREISSKEG